MLQAGSGPVVLCGDSARGPFAAPVAVAAKGNFSSKTLTPGISLLPEDDWPRRCD